MTIFPGRCLLPFISVCGEDWDGRILVFIKMHKQHPETCCQQVSPEDLSSCLCIKIFIRKERCGCLWYCLPVCEPRPPTRMLMTHKHKENFRFNFRHPWERRGQVALIKPRLSAVFLVVGKACKRGGMCAFMTIVLVSIVPFFFICNSESNYSPRIIPSSYPCPSYLFLELSYLLRQRIPWAKSLLMITSTRDASD